MTWRFRAADAAGREVEGDVRAATAADALSQLREQSLWVIELLPVGAPTAARQVSGTADSGWQARVATAVGTRWARWSGQDVEALAVLTRVIATLLAAGVPVERALDYASRDGDDAGEGGAAGAASRTWRALFAAVQRAVRNGVPMSEAMAREPGLPPVFAPSVAAAEASGTLSQTFQRLAEVLERRAQVAARVRGALVYPLVLALSSTIGTLVMLLVVVPRFATLLSDTGQALPLSTRALLAVSVFLTRGGWLLFPALLVALVAFQRRLQDPDRRMDWDGRRLRWPVLGAFERQRDAARYLGTLALALDAGVSLLRAMQLARGTVHNRAYAARLTPAEARVRDGAPLSDALSGELPSLAQQLLQAGEAGGALAPLAARAADAADEAAERQLSRLVSLIEPAMILGFGGIVALVAIALLQAIYGLNAGAL